MKILVLLGTQNKPFHRLLNAIEFSNFITDNEVIAQIGYTKFKSEKFDTFDFCSQEEINELIAVSDVLIMHAGVGSITNALKLHKKIIVAPRLSKYKEMNNDHQLEIMEAFSKKGYVIPLIDFNQIDEVIKNSKYFEPIEYQSNRMNLVNRINKFIKEY